MCCCGTNCVPLVNNCRSVCLCREACLYVAGFPCTPFSVLHGGSKLLGDKNAGQLYEVIRRLKRLCPAASCHSLSRFEYISSFERNTGNAQSLFEISRLAYWKTWLALCGSLLRSWRSCNIISQSNLVCLWQWHTILMITTLVTTLTLRYEITWQFIDPSLGIHLFPCWCNNCFPPMSFPCFNPSMRHSYPSMRHDYGSPITRRRVYILLIKRNLMVPAARKDFEAFAAAKLQSLFMERETSWILWLY